MIKLFHLVWTRPITLFRSSSFPFTFLSRKSNYFDAIINHLQRRFFIVSGYLTTRNEKVCSYKSIYANVNKCRVLTLTKIFIFVVWVQRINCYQKRSQNLLVVWRRSHAISFDETMLADRNSNNTINNTIIPERWHIEHINIVMKAKRQKERERAVPWSLVKSRSKIHSQSISLKGWRSFIQKIYIFKGTIFYASAAVLARHIIILASKSSAAPQVNCWLSWCDPWVHT